MGPALTHGLAFALPAARPPARLAGYDVSLGMLDRLRKKYPRAETHLLTGATLTGLPDDSCDLVLSTLTVAHLNDTTAPACVPSTLTD